MPATAGKTVYDELAETLVAKYLAHVKSLEHDGGQTLEERTRWRN
jgi:hypothetical protein